MSNAADDTMRELARVRAIIGDAARLHPNRVLLAMLEELIEAACGTNPALKNVMKLQFYRRVRARIATAKAASSAPAASLAPSDDGREDP